MTRKSGKLCVPMGLCLAGMGYALWPYIAGEDGVNVTKSSAVPRIGASLLAAPAAAPHERNPFLNEEQMARYVMLPEVPEEIPEEPPTTSDVASIPEAEPEPLEARLTATVLGRGRPSAIINGRVYRVGETVKGLGDDAWRLAVVERDRVIVRHRTDGRVEPIRFAERPDLAVTSSRTPAPPLPLTSAAGAPPGAITPAEVGEELDPPQDPLRSIGLSSGGSFTRAYASLLKLAIQGAGRSLTQADAPAPAQP